ncbi:hypothetical protein CEG14_03165 [Bordetella genomosp. 1]|uniref:Lipoprotein n=1 Tax=Bordetella genomosp. 1 TaxID=1395607 RepID=A0A261STR8_9BORD|nr:hypothetical protein [Bordetella genomosp. 1]OZI40774.1 hypothetical protein CEG14_03165 [Bordetella genomosp. 1]
MIRSYLSWTRAAGMGLIVGVALAGCAVKKPAENAGAAEPAPPKKVVCTPASANSPMVGTWYSVSRPRGFAGDFQSLTVLSADGTMSYETQLKVGKRTRPALRETGCWTHDNGIYTLQTTQSNGEPVDADDPIYRTAYKVESVDRTKLTLREMKSNGQVVTARRMQPGYRMPY